MALCSTSDGTLKFAMPSSRPAPSPAERSAASRRLDALLDEGGRESFPASDPPAVLVDELLPLAEDDEPIPRDSRPTTS